MTMRSMSIVERGGNFTYEGSAEKVWAPEHGVRVTEAITQMLGPYAQLAQDLAPRDRGRCVRAQRDGLIPVRNQPRQRAGDARPGRAPRARTAVVTQVIEEKWRQSKWTVLLNDDENMIVDSAREFLDGECPTTLVRAMETDPLGYPQDAVGKGGRARMAGHVPAGEGRRIGACRWSISGWFCVRPDARSRRCRCTAPRWLRLTIARDGSEAQQAEYLPDVVAGKSVLTWAFTERDPRFIPEAVQMTREGAG